MASNLYDILEISQSASHEAIEAGYKRLHAKFSEAAAAGDEDATNHLIALREAYRTLSHAEHRRKYDERLEARLAPPSAGAASPLPLGKLLLIVALLAVCGLGYAKYQSDLEKARLAREQAAEIARAAEIEAQREREARLEASQAEQLRLRQESIERQNRERDLAYGKQVSRDVERAEAQARMEQERADRQRAAAERQQQYEFERQLAKERALARQMELERSRNRY